jgi:hypothetical protein
VPRCKKSRKRRGKEEEKKRKEEERGGKRRKEEGKKRERRGKKKRKPTKKGHLFSFTYFLFWELACSSRVHYSFESFQHNVCLLQLYLFDDCILNE